VLGLAAVVSPEVDPWVVGRWEAVLLEVVFSTGRLFYTYYVIPFLL
jgi:hypothetical protein